jgi:hypothetical protein
MGCRVASNRFDPGVSFRIVLTRILSWARRNLFRCLQPTTCHFDPPPISARRGPETRILQSVGHFQSGRGRPLRKPRCGRPSLPRTTSHLYSIRPWSSRFAEGRSVAVRSVRTKIRSKDFRHSQRKDSKSICAIAFRRQASPPRKRNARHRSVTVPPAFRTRDIRLLFARWPLRVREFHLSRSRTCAQTG